MQRPAPAADGCGVTNSNHSKGLFIPLSLAMAAPLTDREAFFLKKKEIDAVRDDELVPVNVEIPYAATTVLGVALRLETLLPELQRLPDYDMQPVLDIRLYAGAASYAHLCAMGSAEPDPTIPQLAAEGAELRDGMLLSAETHVHYKLLPAERVAAIRAGTGPLDMANDLCALSTLYTEYWEQLQAHTSVTKQDVERAGVLGFRLQTAYGAKRMDNGSGPPEPQRTRMRAFAKLVQAWTHVRRGVQFLRGPFGDAESFAPSLYLKRRRKTTTGTELEAPEEPAPVVTAEPGTPVPVPDVIPNA